ncbi:MAG TPA: rhamnogalacturonan acetylesterase [Phycisphaerae bacterium]|nr:rhamnogalacturonan acetylesterase [Phycisphaerae bacterium]
MFATSRRLAAALFACAGLAAAGLFANAAPPAPATGHKPTVWLIGDSTVRNGSFDNGATAGQWGWGHLLHYYFDPSKVNVVNDAMGGTSSKSYQDSPTLWPLVLPKIQPGDYVLMQFGHNDGPASLKGNGDDTAEDTGRGAQPGALKHSFGWYMRQYIEQIKAKGATPIVCSLIPRNRWGNDDKVMRNTNDYALWAKQAAEQDHALFIPLNDLIADKYDQLGRDKVEKVLFNVDNSGRAEGTHPNWKGATLNAQCVVEGIKQLDCPLKNDLLADPKVPDQPDITTSEHGELGPDEKGATAKWESGAARRAAATSQPGRP